MDKQIKKMKEINEHDIKIEKEMIKNLKGWDWKMKNKLTKEFDELLLDVLNQACGRMNSFGENIIDNQCISAYEKACDYLTTKGYFLTTNSRIYTFKKLNKIK